MPLRRRTEIRMNNLALKKDQINAQIEALNARSGVERRQIENRIVWLLRDSITDDPTLEKWVRCELPERLTDRDRQVWLLLFPNEQGDKK